MAPTPTAQQMADFQASVAGALNATALRLSAQAELLPNAGNRLVPAVQNAILGSRPRSLANRLVSLAQSGQLSTSTQALSRVLLAAPANALSQINNYFNTTPVNRLSVNASGQRIPLAQYLGGQLLNQVGNTLGSLAQSFPNVANSMLYSNGATGTPTQAAMNAFSTAYNNALSTAAFQLGSALSLFRGYASAIPQLQPLLWGVSNGINGTTSLLSALQNLPYGTSGFNSAVSTAFGNAYQALVSPLDSFLGMTGQSNLTLPTTGFTSPFGTAYTGGSFNGGFNNGFATGTTSGYIGFGMAPTTFNTNFGTGFNNFISTYNQNLGLGSLGSVTGTGTTGLGTAIGTTGQGVGTAVGTTGQGVGTAVGTTGQGVGTAVGTTGQGVGTAVGTTGTGTTTGTGITVTGTTGTGTTGTTGTGTTGTGTTGTGTTGTGTGTGTTVTE